MQFKGHNAISPCRFCTMKAVPRRSGKKVTYYLTRRKPASYENPDYGNLPLRFHQTVRGQAQIIEGTKQDKAKRRLQMLHGIRGKVRLLGHPADTYTYAASLQTSLFCIDSLDCPRSYPIDLMHLLFENIAPQLISLWRGTYKTELITSKKKETLKQDYVISSHDWSAIEEEIRRSNKTTPSQAVPRVGNIKNKSFWTAETYSYFLMFLGPVVLKGRLPEKYYKHFILLSEITKRLTMLEIKWDALEGLHRGIVRLRGFEMRVLDP